MNRLFVLLLVLVCATAHAGSYTGFSITNPTNDQGVRANNGNVTIHMSLRPALQSGHMIVLNVDGEDGKSSNATSDLTMELKNMSRGLHTITAIVVDKDGNDLIKTEPVSFHVLRVGG
jgi:DnaJ-class molecular chaperone